MFLKRFIPILMLSIMAFSISAPATVAATDPPPGYDHTTYLPLILRGADTLCRFGITYRPLPGVVIDPNLIKNLRVGAFLDWGPTKIHIICLEAWNSSM